MSARLGSAAALWSLTALALWSGALLVCPDGACQTLAVDRTVLDAFHGWRVPWLDTLMTALTWLGSIAVLLPASLLLAWHFHRQGRRQAARLLPLAVGGAWIWAHFTKTLIDRPRPALNAALIDMPVDASFPSAHTLQVTAFGVAWVLALWTARRRKPWLAAGVAMILTATVALSRLYLQVHFPSDVLFGLIAGAGWTLGLYQLTRGQR